MQIALLRETGKQEHRVALVPKEVNTLTSAGHSCTIEKGAGLKAGFRDKAYTDAGASVALSAARAVKDADLVVKVQPPRLKQEGQDEIAFLKKGQMVLSLLSPLVRPDLISALAARRVSAFALEMIPRISRAQSMDVLSSQASLAGYKAVLDAVTLYRRLVPLMMTAAGTVQPARIFIMGVGVAGLQAIATARRLGAVVSASDVRPATKEQVESLNAAFIAVEDEEFKEAQNESGYAKEMSKSYQKKQQALIAETVTSQDIVMTTALIPGKKAPILITEEMVASMPSGSVIMDLAGESGGNCACSEYGKTVTKHEVVISAPENILAGISETASTLFSRNIFNIITHLTNEQNALYPDPDDPIAAGALILKDGAYVHPQCPKPKTKTSSRKT